VSEPPKKPAGRDISDLKARLGLKKGGEAAAQGGRPGAAGNVPPPTAAKIGGFVPPPPGVAPPPGMQPPAPVEPPMPDASVDPFGAMNAMASRGQQAAVAQPEFVIVNDGKPVEQVAQAGKGMRFVKIGAIVLAPLFVGYVFGGINSTNEAINQGIAGAKLLFDEFNVVGKSLTDVQNAFDAAKDRGKGQHVPFDKQLLADLDALKLTPPDTKILFATNYANIDGVVAEKTFRFYQGLTTLFAKIERHKQLSKLDDRKNVPKKEGQYAVVLRVPAQQGDQPSLPFAEMVELGAPICAGDTKVSETGCGEANPPEKFQARTDPQGGWQILPWAKTGQTVTQDSIIVLGDSKVQTAFMVGPQQYVDTIGYMQRVQELDTMVRELSELRGELTTALNAVAQRGKRFSL